MNVWILTVVYDSDEHYVGAFSTEGKALSAAASFGKRKAWTSIVKFEMDSNELLDIELCGTGD